MALTQIKSGAIADDAIDSSTYIDGSIDNAHLADDAVDGDKLANNIDVAGTLDVTGVATFDTSALVGLTTAVGIGGTPADLNSTEVGRGYINISRDDTQAADQILFGKNGSVASSIGTSTTNSLTFKTGTTERMRIDDSGRLLVGTTSAGTNGTADDLVVANNGSASDQAGITIRGGTTGRSQIFFSDGTSGDAEYAGMLRYDHDENSMQFRTAATTAMRIDSSGRVGIGTTDTAGFGRTFIVNGTGGFNSDSGDVGIGFNRGSSTTIGYIGTGDWAVTGAVDSDFGIASKDDLVFGTGTGTPVRMRIDSSGDAEFAGSVKIGGTAAANEIEEYEEGTWTPHLYKGSTQITSPVNLHGYYVRIGHLVWLDFSFYKDAVTTTGTGATDYWSIQNLPFTLLRADAGGGYQSCNAGEIFPGVTYSHTAVQNHRWQVGPSKLILYGPYRVTNASSSDVRLDGTGVFNI